MKYLILFSAAAALALSVATGGEALAQGKSDKAKPNKGNAEKMVQGKKPVPPGQIKRYTRGAKLPADVDYVEIDDLSKWKLDPPGQGNKYIKVDNEILKVTEDVQTVVDAVGIVDDLLR